ncbi:MAG: hypothetical protein LBS74_03420 [Oscillospiraceae bacterium]|jgi:hypothetical protein|nr:hypothetical protein [Oscillospiraceae bacterium]
MLDFLTGVWERCWEWLRELPWSILTGIVVTVVLSIGTTLFVPIKNLILRKKRKEAKKISINYSGINKKEDIEESLVNYHYCRNPYCKLTG